MLDIPFISAVIAAIGVIVGVVFAVLQLRDLVKTRQTDLILRLYAAFSAKEFLKTWDEVRKRDVTGFADYEKKYDWSEALEIGMFFEGIGVLLRRRLINIDLVDDLFTGPIKTTWESLEDLTKDAREQQEAPTLFEWFEYLYNEMKRREQTQQP
ncbi:MAG: hypothetical protein NWE78_08320 [Candidatus Bathyarchaeota archaeon]|nr:hypothetical protein [Candidatus Bathyarchaeota archaeon]